MSITKKDILSYNEKGYLRVNEFLSSKVVTDFKNGLLKLIIARAKSVGLNIIETNLDLAFNQLCNHNRKLGGDIYDHAKGLVDFHSQIATPKMYGVIKKLLDKEVVQVAHSQNVFRIDRPLEDNYGFDWHQDFWYNCLTTNAITVWIPLTDVDEDLGQLQILADSHRNAQPVVVLDCTNSEGNMAQIFKLSKLTKIDQSKIIKMPMKAGDALFFHSYLLHRSGKNKSNKNRWTIQYRYADFLNNEYTKRGWSHGTHRGKVNFCDIHPDLIVSE